MWGDCNLNDKRLVRIMTMESWKFFFQFSSFFASKTYCYSTLEMKKKSPKYYSKHDLKMAHTNRNYFTYFFFWSWIKEMSPVWWSEGYFWIFLGWSESVKSFPKDPKDWILWIFSSFYSINAIQSTWKLQFGLLRINLVFLEG